MIVCWAAKGGSGTTVVACALAMGASSAEPGLLVDLAGDCATALGIVEPTGPGVADWMTSPTAGSSELDRLAVTVRDDARLVPRGEAPWPDEQWQRLAAVLSRREGVVVDAGTGAPPRALHDAADHSLLVTRPCYLALRRAQRLDIRPTGIVLVNEPGRALRAADVERALGVPVVADVLFDPAVARAVDAGLMAARVPRSLVTSLRAAA